MNTCLPVSINICNNLNIVHILNICKWIHGCQSASMPARNWPRLGFNFNWQLMWDSAHVQWYSFKYNPFKNYKNKERINVEIQGQVPITNLDWPYTITLKFHHFSFEVNACFLFSALCLQVFWKVSSKPLSGPPPVWLIKCLRNQTNKSIFDKHRNHCWSAMLRPSGGASCIATLAMIA